MSENIQKQVRFFGTRRNLIFQIMPPPQERRRRRPKPEQITEPNSYFPDWLLAQFFLQMSESERQEINNFFDGISRVLMVTGNKKKLGGLKSWLHTKLGIIRGTSLIPIDKISSQQEEPKWDQALLVAMHKTSSGIAELKTQAQKRKCSGSTAVFGSDIVVMINTPSLNLSRDIPKDYLDNPEKYDEYTRIINKHVDRLKQAYCQPAGANLAYDVALAVSAEKNGKYYQAVTGVRVIVKLRQIPEALVADTIQPLIPGKSIKSDRPVRNYRKLFSINAGLPIVDEDSVFTDYIESVIIVPIRLLAQDDGHVDHDTTVIKDWQEAENFDFTKLDEKQRIEALAKLRLILIGGIPPNANKLVQNYVGKDKPNGYTIY